MMPKDLALIESTPLSMLPRGFDYYAGGHIHIVKNESFKNYKNVVYPGPLFPASFSELEKLGNGGFYIYDNGKIHREEINLKNIFCIDADANHRTPEEVYNQVIEKIQKRELINTVVLMRIHGTLKTGKVSDIRFNELIEKMYLQGAFFVMKNTSKLSSEEFEEVKIDHENIENAEDALIREHLQQFTLFDKDKEYHIVKDLMGSLSAEKHEGEKVHEYEERIRKEADKVLDV